MKKQKILFAFVLGLLLTSCNLFNSSSSGSTNSITTITNNETTSNQPNNSNSSILPSTSNDQPLTSSSTTDNTSKERYIYDGYYHWKNFTEVEDKKENYNPHNYVEGKCVDCGYIEVSNEYLTFEAVDEETYGVKSCNEEAVEITIPYFYENKEVVAILDEAFYYCKSLTCIVIPSSVTTSIGEDAFYNCDFLTSVYYQGTIEDWCKIQFVNGKSAPLNSSAHRNIVHFYMLDQNNLYQEVTKIEIPNTITAIGKFQFMGFNNISEIIIPSSVTSIGDYAFFWCSSLTSIIIPKGVISIGEYAFSDCDLLIICEAESQPSGWDSKWDGYIWNDYYHQIIWGYSGKKGVFNGLNYAVSTKDGNKYITITGYDESNTKVEIPETIDGIKVTTIANSAFRSCKSIRNIDIPNSVTYIGLFAFEDCISLEVIFIPHSVTSIESYTFRRCTSLEGVFIPNSVTSIGDFAFSDCASLTSIIIPSSVTSIGHYAFEYCASLAIYCEAENQPTDWKSDWDVTICKVVWGYSGKKGVFNGLNYAVSTKDGNKYITITGYDESNTEVEIPETIDGIKVTTIANSAFRSCKSIKNIYIPNSVTSLGNYAFSDCDSLTIYCEVENQPSGWNSKWNNSNRPVVWNYVGKYGIYNGLSYAVSIKDGSKYITITGYDESNTIVKIPKTINGIEVTTIANGAFRGCASLQIVFIPSSVISIGKYAFRNSDSLIICCEAESQPSGWDSDWNSSCGVMWNIKEELFDQLINPTNGYDV